MDDFDQLALRISKDADDLDAWKTLLELVDDPEKKKDCQGQINRILAKRQPPVICPKCGAGMNIYFAEPLHDKRAKCPYCGTEIDIPDSYSSVTVEKQTGHGKILPETEVTVYERRADSGNQIAGITSDEIKKIIAQKGLAAARQELVARGIKDVKIDQLDESNELNKIIEEQGTDALKSKGIISVGPKQFNQFNRIIGWFRILVVAFTIIFLLIAGLKYHTELLQLFQSVFGGLGSGLTR